MDSVSTATSTINSPAIDPQTMQPTMRAIRDTDQAYEIIKALENENKERTKVQTRIMERYNAESPVKQADLEAQGLGYKSNFSTKPLPHLIDKVAPRFTAVLKKMRYLTNSAFPENYPGANVKTEAFRKEITKLCRNREGWNDFISDISQENALFGFTSVACHDEATWFPKHHRQDSFFVPRGTGHSSGSAQFYVAREEFLLHTIFQLVQNRQAAEVAGWNVENTIEAINTAVPDDKRSSGPDVDRIYADLSRELAIGTSFANGARAVVVYHFFATEVTGKVSHYILWAKNGKQLFAKEDRYDSMPDCVRLFSFQHGNGKLHGSKGIGREVYKMAGALDRARNEVVDRLHMAGKIVLTAQERDIKRFRMTVFGNAVIIPDQFVVSQTRIDGAVEPFLKLDEFFTRLLDQIAGTTSPRATEGERITKAQIELEASREEEGRDNVMDRFLSQFVGMMTMIQKRACDPRCSEPDALQMQQRLLQIMTPDELAYIAAQAPAETVEDFSERERQAIILVAQEGRGVPLYNQKELERRKLTAQVNSEFADAVLMPDNDPTQAAEQTRQQLVENTLLANGQSVPVSPRDDFQAHFQTLEPLVTTTLQSLAENPANLQIAKVCVAHAADHLQNALNAGADKTTMQEPVQMVQAWTDAVTQIEQHEAAVQQAAATAPVADPNSAPVAPEPAAQPPIQ
jgi:hypothetical protein